MMKLGDEIIMSFLQGLVKDTVEVFNPDTRKWSRKIASEVGANTIYRVEGKWPGKYSNGTYVSILGNNQILFEDAPKSRMFINDDSNGIILPVYPSISILHIEVIITMMLHKGFYLYPSEFIYCINDETPEGWDYNELQMMLHIVNRLEGDTRADEYLKWYEGIMSIIDHHDKELKIIQEALDA